MFIPVKYGIDRMPVNYGEFLIKCPSCESHQWAEVLVSTQYAHVYSVPIYPIDKDAYVVCNHCGAKRFAVPFNKNLISNYDEVKRSYRHPWKAYMGLIILASPVLLMFIYEIVQRVFGR